jgi:uncharacterized iron-regulated protein
MSVLYRTAYLFWIAVLFSGCATPASHHPPIPYQESPYRDLDSLKAGGILHVPTGTEITKDRLFDLLDDHRVIYVGEAHVNLAHHRIQLDILRALEEQLPGRIAVGMEMFQRPSQPVLDRWSRGELSEKEFMKEWYANWSEAYGYYQEILEFIRDRKIPLIALNASNDDVRRLAEKGMDGLTDQERKALPEMDAGDPFHRAAMRAVFGGHTHGDKGFERFYQTMLLWDETMAQTIADYLKLPGNHDRKMVVFAGGFHVEHGFGIPRRVFRRLPESYAIVLPHTAPERIPTEKQGELLMDVAMPEPPLYLSDFVWATGYEDLEERPVRLGVHIEKGEKGVLVKKVAPDSPAARAGIQDGDVIVSLDDEPIREPFDLSYEVARHKSGDQVSVKILRNNQSLSIKATL